MHGLGADANDMQSLANQLRLEKPVRHVFLKAPTRPVTLNNNMLMPAWYDITGIKFTDREDRQGILDSEQKIHAVIDMQLEKGLKPEQIFLAGFSQGGAMALFSGLRYRQPLGGIAALSSYLPLADECTSPLGLNVPIFAAYGQMDDLVLPAWSLKTIEKLQALGLRHVSAHGYPMAHEVCLNELKDLNDWFNHHFSNRPDCLGA